MTWTISFTLTVFSSMPSNTCSWGVFLITTRISTGTLTICSSMRSNTLSWGVSLVASRIFQKKKIRGTGKSLFCFTVRSEKALLWNVLHDLHHWFLRVWMNGLARHQHGSCACTLITRKLFDSHQRSSRETLRNAFLVRVLVPDHLEDSRRDLRHWHLDDLFECVVRDVLLGSDLFHLKTFLRRH